MALGDAVLFRQRSMEGMAGGQLGAQLSLSSVPHNMDELVQRTRVHADEAEEPAAPQQDGETVAYLPPNLYLCDLRHDAGETSTSLGPAESGLVSKWRMKDRALLLGSCKSTGDAPLVTYLRTDENRVCGTSTVPKYRGRSSRCYQDFSMCKNGVLDRSVLHAPAKGS